MEERVFKPDLTSEYSSSTDNAFLIKLDKFGNLQPENRYEILTLSYNLLVGQDDSNSSSWLRKFHQMCPIREAEWENLQWILKYGDDLYDKSPEATSIQALAHCLAFSNQMLFRSLKYRDVQDLRKHGGLIKRYYRLSSKIPQNMIFDKNASQTIMSKIHEKLWKKFARIDDLVEANPIR